MNSPAIVPPAFAGAVTFRTGADGLTRLAIATAAASAEVILQGAHLTHFQPAGQPPVLFMSDASYFAPGKPVRGGVPVCFPWFGPRADHPESPAHGFARIVPWEVESIDGSPDAGAAVTLRLASSQQTRAHWPHEFVARLRIEVARQLTLVLSVENTDAAPFRFEAALHTYFAVFDVRQVAVTGLAGAAYLDKTDGLRRKELGPEPLRFERETDWIFPGNTATCTIDDPGQHRRIVVEKSGSRTTVVWNPWIAKAAAMPDFGDDEWPRIACIETANVGDDAVTLAPGASHTMTAKIAIA